MTKEKIPTMERTGVCLYWQQIPLHATHDVRPA